MQDSANHSSLKSKRVSKRRKLDASTHSFSHSTPLPFTFNPALYHAEGLNAPFTQFAALDAAHIVPLVDTNVTPFLFAPPGRYDWTSTANPVRKASECDVGRIVITACTTCHRVLSTSSSCVVTCARCKTPTCTICSRTCDPDSLLSPKASPDSGSSTPQPPIRLSSTDRMAISPPASPPARRRPLNTTTTENVQFPSHGHDTDMDGVSKPRTALMKRSLVEEDEGARDGADEDEDEGTDTEREGDAVGLGSMHEDDMEDGAQVRRHKGAKRGCGRTFCHACTVEDSTRHITFCLDCVAPS